MRKIKFGTLACEVVVTENCVIRSEGSYPYGRSTIAYAVERFFANSSRFREDSTYESWQLRLGKGKSRAKKFCYLIPATLMDLPGEWVRLGGIIDTTGVKIRQVYILKELPGLQKKKKSERP